MIAESGQVTNYSNTITAGGTAQPLLPTSMSRHFFYFQNVSDTAMWLNFFGPAVAAEPSISVPAGGVVQFDRFCPSNAVSVLCATTGKGFTCLAI